MTDFKKLDDAADESIRLGKSTLAFDFHLSALASPAMQPKVRRVQALKPEFTPHQLKIADAVERCDELRNEGFSKDEAARAVAKQFGLRLSVVFKAAIDRENQEAVAILRARHSLFCGE